MDKQSMFALMKKPLLYSDYHLVCVGSTEKKLKDYALKLDFDAEHWERTGRGLVCTLQDCSTKFAIVRVEYVL